MNDGMFRERCGAYREQKDRHTPHGCKRFFYYTEEPEEGSEPERDSEYGEVWCAYAHPDMSDLAAVAAEQEDGDGDYPYQEGTANPIWMWEGDAWVKYIVSAETSITYTARRAS